MQNLADILCSINNSIPILSRALVEASSHVGEYTWSARTEDFGFWLLCDGRSLDRAKYNALFDVIGTSFGAPSGTTFRLPDFQGRVMAAVGSGSGLTVRTLGNRVGAEAHSLSVNELPSHNHPGTVGTTGEHSHTLNSSGAHTHNTNATGGSIGLAIADGTNTVTDADSTPNELNVWTPPTALVMDPAGSHTHTMSTDGSHTHTFTSTSVGSDAPHNNMQPTLFAGCVFIYAGRSVA